MNSASDKPLTAELVRSATFACCRPDSTRFTASSVSITELGMDRWISPKIDRT